MMRYGRLLWPEAVGPPAGNGHCSSDTSAPLAGDTLSSTFFIVGRNNIVTLISTRATNKISTPVIDAVYWVLETPEGWPWSRNLSGAAGAVAIFSTKANALFYQDAASAILWEPQLTKPEVSVLVAATARQHTTESLSTLIATAKWCGEEFVVIDPSPFGEGRVVTVTKAIFELSLPEFRGNAAFANYL